MWLVLRYTFETDLLAYYIQDVLFSFLRNQLMRLKRTSNLLPSKNCNGYEYLLSFHVDVGLLLYKIYISQLLSILVISKTLKGYSHCISSVDRGPEIQYFSLDLS